MRFEFTRMVAHWAGYSDPGYLSFIEDARPEVVQVGFYGAHFWGLAHTPQFKGYPAHFPIRGLKECGDWFENLNRELHKRKAKVVGHINVKFLVGDPDGEDGPRGFFKFYRELWDEKEMGPKPVEDPLELLEKNADGSLIVNHNYRIGGMAEYWGCLLNPNFRAVLKAWVKRGIERGLDGFVINYFYRHNCMCDYCKCSFKEYLNGRFGTGQLSERFGITDLASHRFKEIVGWHNPKETTPLRIEMLRFSQIANKRAFDEVFVEYGRSLKPDLILSQWNHLGNFSQINDDERCLLPPDLWGKNEDYLWYSSGGSANFTVLEEGYLGEITLQARYVRGAFEDKPFTFGKYELTRIRVAIAELAANGGAPMGFYTRFTDPAARKEIVRYYNFLERYDEIYRANKPHAEMLLLFPRIEVHEGNVGPVETFKKIGKRLLEEHTLFEVIPDDLARTDDYTRHQKVFAFYPSKIEYEKRQTRLSRFEAPETVRVSASAAAQGDEIDIHFVNYNREEPTKKRSPGGGIKDEKPIPVKGIKVSFVLPKGERVRRIEFITPETPEPKQLRSTTAGGRVRFRIPEFLVYGVARIWMKKGTVEKLR